MDPNWLSGIGGLLGGAAALGAVLVAWLQGRKELAKWRNQKREDKRAEVAGGAIVAALRVLGALEGIVSPLMVRKAENPEDSEASEEEDGVPPPFAAERRKDKEREALVAELNERWRAAQDDLVAFYSALDLAQAYLPEEAIIPLEQIEDFRREVWAAQTTYTLPQVYGFCGLDNLYHRALGPKPRARVQELRQEMLQALRPLASLEEVDARRKPRRKAPAPGPLEESAQEAPRPTRKVPKARPEPVLSRVEVGGEAGEEEARVPVQARVAEPGGPANSVVEEEESLVDSTARQEKMTK